MSRKKDYSQWSKDDLIERIHALEKRKKYGLVWDEEHTKAGITATTAKAKAEGLARYIRAENKRGKNLFGGIVVYKDDSWRYNDQEKYNYNENDLRDWKFLT